MERAPYFRTTGNAWVNQGGPTIPPDSVCHVTGWAFASNHAGGAARWQIEATVYRVGSGPALLASSLPEALTSSHRSQQANLWDIRLTLAVDEFLIEVHGGAAEIVDWIINYDEPDCMVGIL